MNDYEILLLLDPELPDERQTEIVTRTRETIEKGGGKWADHQPWGRRRLAYEIDHKAEGAYHLLTFDAVPEALDEVSRVLRITDGVMRHLAVRRVKGASTRPPEPSSEAPRREEPRREEPVAAAAVSSQDSEPEETA